MKWDVEVIRYEKGKKEIEHDMVEADGFFNDDHNNLILFNGTYQNFLNDLKFSDYTHLVQQYHSYNYISIQPAK